MTTNSISPSLPAKRQQDCLDTKKTREIGEHGQVRDFHVSCYLNSCRQLSYKTQQPLVKTMLTIPIKYQRHKSLMHKIHLGNFHTRLVISTDIITANNPWWALKQTVLCCQANCHLCKGLSDIIALSQCTKCMTEINSALIGTVGVINALNFLPCTSYLQCPP